MIVRACESYEKLRLKAPEGRRRTECEWVESWDSWEWDCVREGRRRAEAREPWRGAQRPERERELKMRTVDWDIGFLSKRCVLQLFIFYFYFSQTVRFAPFVFLFFEFRPESAGSAPVSVVVADTDRFGPNRRVSRRKKEKKRNTAPTRRQRRRSPHPASVLHKYSPFWKI